MMEPGHNELEHHGLAQASSRGDFLFTGDWTSSVRSAAVRFLAKSLLQDTWPRRSVVFYYRASEDI